MTEAYDSQVRDCLNDADVSETGKVRLVVGLPLRGAWGHRPQPLDVLLGMRGPRCRLEREVITSSRLVQVVSIQFDCAKRSSSKWFEIEDPSDRYSSAVLVNLFWDVMR